MIFCLFIITSCEKENVNVAAPKAGPVTIQMHNFNIPLNGGTLDGTAPDIYYFKQKEDGSYVFMMTFTDDGNFETDWATKYVLVSVDETGVILKKETKTLPLIDGIIGTFKYVWDAPPSTTVPWRFSKLPYNRATSGPSYVADEQGFLYYMPHGDPNSTCFCKNQFFNLNPETGHAEFISVGTGPGLGKSFRTADGGFISVGWQESPNFAKYDKSGTLQFKQPMKYWEARPSYDLLTERNGDFYFIALYNGGYSTYDYPLDDFYDPPTSEGIYESFSDNKATSFFYLKNSYVFDEIEIMFGPGRKQKAHRFDSFYNYQDYVEVPFEVWDTKRNMQIMVSFIDVRRDGKFDLVPFNFDSRKRDPAHSFELIYPHDANYAEIPDQDIMSGGFLNDNEPEPFVWAYLAEGATWDDTALPEASFSQKRGTRPGPQLIKVNANGSTVVKENFILGSGGKSLKTLYKSVPLLDGFAVLINAQQVTNDPSDLHLGSYGYQPTQLVLLDADFNQTNIVPVESRPDDYGHQLESNKDQIFYARITVNPTSTSSNVSLLLSTVRNNVEIKRYLDFDVETFRITPTKSGGVSLLVWVRPTENTRDLLFMELDENLNLITSRGN